MPRKTLTATATLLLCLLMGGCATSTKEGFNGPSVNMDEPQYESSMARSKDRPAVEKGAQVDFFKIKQGF